MRAISGAFGRPLAAAVAIAISLCAFDAFAAEKVIYLTPAPEVLPAFAPWALAKYKGYYKDEGIDIEFRLAKGGVDVAKQIGAGNALIGGGIGDTPLIVRANGVPVKSVALIGGGTLMLVGARADAGIKGPKDLKGKTISVMSYADTSYYALLGTLASVGLHKSDVNAEAVGPAGVPQLVIAGKAQACACVPDWIAMIEASGNQVHHVLVGRLLPEHGASDYRIGLRDPGASADRPRHCPCHASRD